MMEGLCCATKPRMQFKEFSEKIVEYRMTNDLASRTWHDRVYWGMLLTILGQLFHITGGVFEKLLLGIYPVPQMVFVRSLLRILPLGIALLYTRETKNILRIEQPLCHLFRLATYVAYNYCMLYALSIASLTTNCALQYITPFFTLILSTWILKETISRHQWIAIGVSTIGVLVAIGSSGGFEIVFFVILLGSLVGSLNKILIRQLVATEHSLLIALSGNVALALVLVPANLTDWHPISWHDLGCFAIASFLTATAQYATVQALRFAQASILAPLDYTSLLWAGLFDFFMWEVIPSSHMTLGAILLICSNLYLLKSTTYKKKETS